MMASEFTCPERDKLRRSLDPDDSMSESERQSIEAHLEVCSRGCKEAVSELLRGSLRPTDFSLPNTLFADPAPSQVAAIAPPGYELLEELGRGGQSIVYKARQRDLDRFTAVKILLRGSTAGAQDRARFRREALAVAQLKHPQIVEIYDVGECEGQLYCVLEYLAGGSLATKLARLPQPPREAAALAETLARAVHVAHQQGIVHRDLKPANVLLTPDGRPKITDFGLARRVEEESGLTHTGSIMGTPSYMAPEQARGRKDVGAAADIYALGAVLYEMLTGRPPFLGTSPWDVLPQVLEREPVAPRKLQPKIDLDLETICLKCLAKDPARRYSSAEALADDLRRYLAGESIHARATPWWEKAQRWARRRPAVASLLVALATVVAGALVGLSLLYWNAEHQRSLAHQNELGAQAVTRFLEENLLTAARPLVRGGKGYDITLQDALKLASTKIDAAFAGQPLREAAVRHTLGMTYFHLGIFEEEEDHLAKAYRLRRKHLGPDHPDTLASQHYLAIRRGRQDEYTEMIKLAADALERRRRILGRLHADTLATQLALGYGYRKLRRFSEAAVVLDPVVVDCERALGPQHPQTLNALFESASLLWEQGRKAEAIPIMRKSFERSRDSLGAEYPETVRAMYNLGVMLAGTGDYEAATPLCRDAWQGYRKVLGPLHRETLWSGGYYADVLCCAGNLAEAEAPAREAESALGAILPAHTPEMLEHRALLAEILLRTDRAAEAEELLRECLAGLTSPDRETAPGKGVDDGDYWHALAVRSLLGRSLALQEKFAEAEPLLLQGYAELVAAKTARDIDRKHAAEGLADFYDRRELPEEAAQWRTKAELHGGSK